MVPALAHKREFRHAYLSPLAAESKSGSGLQFRLRKSVDRDGSQFVRTKGRFLRSLPVSERDFYLFVRAGVI